MKIVKIIGLIVLASCVGTQKLSAPEKQLLEKNQDATGISFQLEFVHGKAHNHPSFVFWLEDMDGNFLQTLFVTRFVASGIYGHGHLAPGKWKETPGEAERPATLPYWLHKRNVLNEKGSLLPSPDMPVPDAYTAATPSADFVLKTKADHELPRKFRLLMEINQAWDSNEYWYNNRFPESWDYKASLQPALVYAVSIDRDSPGEYFLNPIGHSHWAGENGKLYTNINTLTSAKEIIKYVCISIN